MHFREMNSSFLLFFFYKIRENILFLMTFLSKSISHNEYFCFSHLQTWNFGTCWASDGSLKQKWHSIEELHYIRINIMKSFFKSVLSCTRLSLQYPKMRRKICSNINKRDYLQEREKSSYKHRCFKEQIHTIKLWHSCFIINKKEKQEKHPLKSHMI